MSTTLPSGNGITNKLLKLRHSVLNHPAHLCYLPGLENSNRKCGCAAIPTYSLSDKQHKPQIMWNTN